MNEELIKLYSNGSSVQYIANKLKTSKEHVLKQLKEFKESSKHNKSYTDEFGEMIANRDMGGVSRTSIANELGINSGTIRNFCNKFGQLNKGKSTFGNLSHTFVRDGCINEICPICDSKRLNSVQVIVDNRDRNAYYCMSCDNEVFEINDKVYKTNWEYISE